MSNGDAILLDKADDVATVLREIEEGESVSIVGPSDPLSIVAKERIPIFHKIAIKPLPSGADVLKYGDSIGVLVTDIDKGALVHVHNLRSRRAGANKK